MGGGVARAGGTAAAVALAPKLKELAPQLYAQISAVAPRVSEHLSALMAKANNLSKD